MNASQISAIKDVIERKCDAVPFASEQRLPLLASTALFGSMALLASTVRAKFRHAFQVGFL